MTSAMTMRVLVLIALALPSIAQADDSQTIPADADTLLADWHLLMQSGCNIKARRIRTPIGARVLRNVPYAAQGYVFKAPELTRLFSEEAGWYAPKAKAVMTFKPATLACIRALKQHEARLRKRLKWAKSAEEAFVTARQNLVHGIRFRMRMTDMPLGSYSITQDTDAGKPVFVMSLEYSYCDSVPKDPMNPCDNPGDHLVCSATQCTFIGSG